MFNCVKLFDLRFPIYVLNDLSYQKCIEYVEKDLFNLVNLWNPTVHLTNVRMLFIMIFLNCKLV